MLTFRTYIAVQKCGSRSSSSSLHKQAEILQKLISASETRKQRKGNANVKIKTGPFLLSSHFENSSKRMTILNKTFLIHISQIMATGKNSSHLQELGIEITGVKIDKSLQNLRVYWHTQNHLAQNEELSEVLTKTAAELQLELNSYGVMGKCPNISFVRDITIEKITQLENTFNSLGLSEPEHCTNDNNEGKILSFMRQDVFGLDHLKIMNSIKADMKRKYSVAKKRMKSDSNDVDDLKLIPFSKLQFHKFNKRKQILSTKMKKHKSDWNDNESSEYNSDDDHYT